MNIIDYLFSDKNSKRVYGQKPNPPIITAGIFYALSFFTEGAISTTAGWVGRIAILYWAYLELASGVNKFRKLMGLTVMFFIILGLVGPIISN